LSDPVVLIWGESDFLLREAAQRLFEGVRPTEVEAVGWRPGLTADLATPSLLGETRAMLVTGLQAAPSEALEEISRYALEPNPESRLVLTYVVSARAKGPPAKVLKPLQGRSRIERIAIDRKELPRWVMERARKLDLKATPAGATALVETVGEDPGVLGQSVAQLADAFREEGLTPATVATQFRGFGERRIFELCDAAFGGNARDALRYLAAMLGAREQPLAILGGVAARVRDLLRVRSLPPAMPLKAVAREAGLRFDWQARRYREQAGRYEPEELADIHRRVVAADAQLKQGGQGDVVLTMLVTRIAGRTVGAR
jgi:DNA polymerase-3 subunit delta